MNATAATPRRTRRTQAERTADTRGRILDAAVAMLHQRGHADTTTTAVVEQAGLSRGAVLHHFGSRLDMLRAVVEHVYDLQVAFYAERLTPIVDPRARVLATFDAAWEFCQTPAFTAWLEIWLATRNDFALRLSFGKWQSAFEERSRTQIETVVKAAGVRDRERLEGLLVLINSAFIGMALHASIYRDLKYLRRAKEELRAVVESLLPAPRSAPAPSRQSPSQAASRSARPRTAPGAGPGARRRTPLPV